MRNLLFLAVLCAASAVSAGESVRVAWGELVRVVAIATPGEAITETVAATEVRPSWISAQCGAGTATLTVRVGQLEPRLHAVGAALLRVLPNQVVAQNLAVVLSPCRDPATGQSGIGTLVIDAGVRN